MIEFEYMIGTPRGIEHFTEIHELGLFTKQEYLDAFRLAGLEVTHDPARAGRARAVYRDEETGESSWHSDNR